MRSNDLQRVSERVASASIVCFGAESVVEPHGKAPHFELQGPARG